MINSIPTESDWSGYESDLDASWSHRIFFGKSAEDVRPLFEANVVDAAANIFRMPKEAFEYYLMAFARYVVSIDASSSDGASDAASCLLNYVLLTLQQEAEKLKNISHDLLPIIETIAASQERYDAPPNIYGSFVEKRDEIFRLTDGLLKSAT